MRILEAICSEGKVFIGNGAVEVPNVKILSEGGDSEGILLMAGGELVYVAQTSPDLKSALTIIKSAFTTLSGDVVAATGGLTDIGGATPTFAADMLQVSANLNELIGKLK